MIKRYIINDNTCMCTLDPQFNTLKDAHECLMSAVQGDIESCCSSNYEVYDTSLNCVVLRYQSDNIERFTVDNLRARIITLLEGCAECVRDNDEYFHKRILEEVIRLEDIMNQKLHPEWY